MKRNVRAEYSIDADDYEAIGASDPDTGETTIISLIVYRGTALAPELVALELAPADEIEDAKEALWLAACEQERRERRRDHDPHRPDGCHE